MIHLRCPKCQTLLSVEDALAGTVLVCPDCSVKMRVPARVQEPPAESVAVSATPLKPPPLPESPVDELEVVDEDAFSTERWPAQKRAETVIVRLFAPGVWLVSDMQVPIYVDGQWTAHGHFRSGFDIVVKLRVGEHEIRIGTTKYTLEFDRPGRWEVEFAYSRSWGNFKGTPIIRHVPADETVDWPFLDDHEPIDLDTAAGAISFEDQAVLAELAALENQKQPWGVGIGILLLTLLLFMGAAGVENLWDNLFILIPVLVFHEAGHFLAMRLFGYRNVRMFFIPFFGAAVMGRHYNVAGWKKAIVALAGPVPGIVIAIPIAFAGTALREDVLINAASMLVFLNGFNLLPLLPLDGGRVTHVVLFVRHPLLDVVFRVLAALAMIGLAFLFTSWILGLIAVSMLIGTPFAYRLARISHRLREEGLEAYSPDANSIPTATALQILGELRRDIRQQLPPKTLALNIANIFENFNAEPPELLASIALLFAQGASFAAALALAIFLTLFRFG